MSFRRNFDQEAVDIANGRRPSRQIERYGTTRPSKPPPIRKLVIFPAQTAEVRGEIAAMGLDINSVVGDWHVAVNEQPTLDRLISLLQRRRIHGIIMGQSRMR